MLTFYPLKQPPSYSSLFLSLINWYKECDSTTKTILVHDPSISIKGLVGHRFPHVDRVTLLDTIQKSKAGHDCVAHCSDAMFNIRKDTIASLP